LQKSAASKSQTADSAEKTESNNKKKKNDKSKANAVVAKQGKAESGKTKAEDKNKQQKTKRVIDEVIKAAVLNELTERKGGSKPKPYKLIRDEVCVGAEHAETVALPFCTTLSDMSCRTSQRRSQRA